MTSSNAERVIAALIASRQTLAVAESLTAGLVAARLADVPGASAALLGGVVAYATPLKHQLLRVPHELLESTGPVHPDVARAMARGVRATCAVAGADADVGVATTGVAGPASQADAPVGLVYVAVADARGEEVRELRLSGSRADIREAAVDAAIALLAERVRVRE